MELLTATDRLPEAALFARTYIPSLLPGVVAAWKEQLAKVVHFIDWFFYMFWSLRAVHFVTRCTLSLYALMCQTHAKAAHALASPAEYPNLFSELDFGLRAEDYLRCAHT